MLSSWPRPMAPTEAKIAIPYRRETTSSSWIISTDVDMSDTAVGLLLCVAAGAASGSFTIPMKFARGWAWKNTWFVWATIGLVAMPIGAALATVPRIEQVYADVGPGLVATVAIFGLGWGVAQLLFGIAVQALGMAIAFSIVIGMSVDARSVVPMLHLGAKDALSPGGFATICGIALVILAMAMRATAGRWRETAQLATGRSFRPQYGRGLTFALGSGLGSAMINMSLAFGTPLLDGAAALRSRSALGC